MKFCKEKFLKHADKATKDRVRPHLDVLDGKEVEYGSVINYKVDGKAWMLYPVMDEWCEV